MQRTLLLFSFLLAPGLYVFADETTVMKVTAEPLVRHLYTADPSAHAFGNKLYVYPSHDWESGITDSTDGNKYQMKDYHVFSMSDVGGEVIDHGAALTLTDIPWASQQLWAPDAAEKNGKYYLYFPAKDQDLVFRMGVGVSDKPEGPFVPQPQPIPDSFSIDPAVFKDDDGSYYMYFGGIQGGQLQQWKDGKHTGVNDYPADEEPALMPQIAKMSDDMLGFAEKPLDVLLVDRSGNPLIAGDNDRRFFEAAWVHKHRGWYYLSWSTGDTHKIVYGVGRTPYGPFVYQGVILEEVLGWTNHHSIVDYKGKTYLFFHDTSLSLGQDHLRSIKVTELHYKTDGSIARMNAMVQKP